MDLMHIAYLIAITAEAMSAALSAGRRNMDWFGVCVVACITALGGGSIRDILLGHHPLSWVAHPSYLLITAGAAVVTMIVAPMMRHLRMAFLLLDAVGLVVFTIFGCNVAIGMQLPFLIVLVSGMITGTFGGVLRDVLCNDIPLLFRKELYASVSLVTGGLYLSSVQLGVLHWLGLGIALAIGLLMRILAIRYHWEMPKFAYVDEWE
ncbi:MAG TPA: trimeric intracellular cation channel family protein [Rhodanobacter sp.]|nr:trimeric intracellular cation channel family protein [Rhodanobacter sp.]